MESIFHWSIATLSDPLHWGISIFWRYIRLILYIGTSDGWYRDHWIVSCCPHYILGHSHLVGYFGHRDLTFYLRLLLSIDYEAIDTLGLVFSAYLDDLEYLHTFHFVLKHFTIDTSMPSILLEPYHYLLLSPTSHHDTWPHTPLSIRKYVD